jgi:peptide/nickel transport system substrate-binding protein
MKKFETGHNHKTGHLEINWIGDLMMKKALLISLAFCLFLALVISEGAQTVFAEEKDKYGGIFKIAFWKPAMNFGNPLRLQGPDKFYADFCLQHLLQPSDKQGTFEPLLATRWELSPDGKAYIFHLRKGVKFHDGTVFNAQAVKWNLDRVVKATRARGKKPPGPPPGPPAGPPGGGPPGKGPKGKRGGPPPGGPMLSKVTSIDVIDDYTVRLNLSSWDNLILRDLMNGNSCFMVSPTAVKKNGEAWSNTHPVGTGPFKFKAFRRNVYVKYERFEDYWEKGLPYLDGVEVLSMPDPMTAIASLKSGEVHALNEIDRVTAGQLASEGHYEIARIPGLRIIIVGNAKDPKSVWSDKRMREALEFAIDKDRIVKTIGRGYSKAFYEIIPNVPGDPVTTPRKYNPEKAKNLIKEAGYPNGIDCKLNFFAEAQKDFWLAIQDNLNAVGIRVELTPLSRPALMGLSFQGIRGNDLRMAVMPDAMDPFMVLESFMSPKAILYKELKRPPEAISLLGQVNVEKDLDRQVMLFKKMEALVYNVALFIPLWSEPLIRAVDPRLKDYIAYFKGYNELRLQHAWFKKK